MKACSCVFYSSSADADLKTCPRPKRQILAFNNEFRIWTLQEIVGWIAICILLLYALKRFTVSHGKVHTFGNALKQHWNSTKFSSQRSAYKPHRMINKFISQIRFVLLQFSVYISQFILFLFNSEKSIDIDKYIKSELQNINTIERYKIAMARNKFRTLW